MADGGPVLPHPLESHKAGRPGPLRATLSRLTPLSTPELPQQITILCEAPWDTESSDVELRLGSDSIVAGVKGGVPLLKVGYRARR
jgi:hypothetical protein